jgi:hypothetical protein
MLIEIAHEEASGAETGMSCRTFRECHQDQTTHLVRRRLLSDHYLQFV